MSEKEDFFKPIAEGIQDGFQEIGFNLSARDKNIIYLTTVAAITIIERAERGEYNDAE